MNDFDLMSFLENEPLATSNVASGTRTWRVHDKDCVVDVRDFRDADPIPHEIIHWSDRGRFGSSGNEVLYVGTTPEGAFLETMCWNPNARAIISRSRLKHYSCSAIDIPETLTLVNLTNEGLLQNGLDANVFAATDPGRDDQRTYRFARQVSAAIHQNPRNYDGILYHSRVNPKFTSIAIYKTDEDRYRRLQSSIESAANVLIDEPWVYQMQRDGTIRLDVL